MRTTERTTLRGARGPARPVAVPRPVTSNDPIEWRLAVSAVWVVLALAVPVVVGAALLAGSGGALGAGIATAVVAGMFLMSAGLLSLAARIGPTALLAAALGGYLLRLMIYALLIVLLRPVEAIHGPSLAISAAILLVAALAWEVRIVSRSPALFWVDANQSRTEGHDTERTKG